MEHCLHSTRCVRLAAAGNATLRRECCGYLTQRHPLPVQFLRQRHRRWHPLRNSSNNVHGLPPPSCVPAQPAAWLTREAFSNCAMAPSTWRTSTAVGVSSMKKSGATQG